MPACQFVRVCVWSSLCTAPNKKVYPQNIFLILSEHILGCGYSLEASHGEAFRLKKKSVPYLGLSGIFNLCIPKSVGCTGRFCH